MEEAQIWALIAFGFVTVFIVVMKLARNAREARRLAAREMLHRERLAAIDKGLPLHELPAELMFEPKDEEFRTVAAARNAALAAGLIIAPAGIGMMVGFARVPDLAQLSPLGLIPIFVGGGLLLYHSLSRKDQ